MFPLLVKIRNKQARDIVYMEAGDIYRQYLLNSDFNFNDSKTAYIMAIPDGYRWTCPVLPTRKLLVARWRTTDGNIRGSLVATTSMPTDTDGHALSSLQAIR